MGKVIKINKKEYVRFMKIMFAKSGLMNKEFYESIGTNMNTAYSWVYDGKVKRENYEMLKDNFGEEEGFNDCFYVVEQEHGNTIINRKKYKDTRMKKKK